jgi:hypothetical protein
MLNNLKIKRSPEIPSFEKGGLGRIYIKIFIKIPPNLPFSKGGAPGPNAFI